MTYEVMQIVLRARRYLGDLPPNLFEERELEGLVYNAADLVNLDVDSNYVVSETVTEGTSISPAPSDKPGHRTLLSLMTGIIALQGEYGENTVDGGGVSWRSGLSSIDLSGQTVSYRDILKTLWERYDRALANVTIGGLTALSVDLYEGEATG